MRQGCGHRPGSLIERIALDLREFEFAVIAPARAEFRSRSGEFRFVVQELLESHFMMHIVSAEFIVHCPSQTFGCDPSDADPIIVRHQGSLRRKGLEFRLSPAASDAARGLCDALSKSTELTAALMPLDFTHCQFKLEPGNVEMRVRHFGACEVVGRLPKFHRYVRLGAEQRDSLVGSFGAFREIIRS